MKSFRLQSIVCPLVFVVAFVIISWNLSTVGIASGQLDPILHLGSQDEATYTREAITMAREGHWMTPTFLGRWIFEKPPLLMWLSAASMKVFGIGRLTARLPVIFAGSLICALCFAIVRRERSIAAGLAAAAMALTSQVLITMARHSMTDILLAAAGMCALTILLRDPGLLRPASLAAFVAAAAAGIMAKSIAGILILLVMAVVVGLENQRWTRAALAATAAIAVASPWFLYNLILHRDWFLADTGFQIIATGMNANHASSGNHVWFYVQRMINSDLLPLLLALTAIPALVRAVRRREPAALLSASYFVIYFAGLMVFRFHTERYLSWFLPSLILIASLYSPLLNGKRAAVVIAMLALVFAGKVAYPDSVFGVSLQPGTTVAQAPVLSRYCAEYRATDLYVLGIDDELYSAVLPLHHVRYGWIDPTNSVEHQYPHLAYLGILIPAAAMPELSQKLTLYRDRLRAWGHNSTEGIATGFSANDAAGLVQLIHHHPESDFLVAKEILPDPQNSTSHRLVFANANFALLESKLAVEHETPAWTCEM
jgi:hypothetical protein